MTIACILIFNLSKFFCAIRLNKFFKQDGVFISEKESLKLYYKGMFYNIMLPGGIGGDGYKGYYLHNTLQVPVKNLVRPILWDRITGAVSIVILIFVLVNFQTFIPDHLGLKIFLVCSPLLIYAASMVAFEYHCATLPRRFPFYDNAFIIKSAVTSTCRYPSSLWIKDTC